MSDATIKCPDCGGPSSGLCSTCSCELERDAERGCPLAAKNEELSAKLDREREYSANLLRRVRRLEEMIEAARQKAVTAISDDKTLNPYDINVALSPWEVRRIARAFPAGDDSSSNHKEPK